jgi:hypothetical protein
MRKINQIIIHSSDSEYGTAHIIDTWHKGRGFSEIGYHFVILNGFILRNKEYFLLDGGIEIGRNLSLKGAHVKNYNQNSIGICLIGKSGDFTVKQRISLLSLIYELKREYKIPIENILGHYELDSRKTCPDINMITYREYLKEIFKINKTLFKE